MERTSQGPYSAPMAEGPNWWLRCIRWAARVFTRTIWPVLRWVVVTALTLAGLWTLEQEVVSHRSHGRLLYWVLGGLLLVVFGQWIQMHNRAKGELEVRAGSPSLEIVTGNGDPWDDPRHGPQPKYLMTGPLDAHVKALSAFTPKK